MLNIRHLELLLQSLRVPGSIPSMGSCVCVRMGFLQVPVGGLAQFAMLWTGIPTRVYSHLMPSVPGIGSGFTVTPTRIKCLLSIQFIE